MNKALIGLLIAIAVGALAWMFSSRLEVGAPPAVHLDADAPLRFVPADTPFVFATLEPLPEALSATLVARAERDFAQMQSLWQTKLDELGKELSKKSEQDPQVSALIAVLRSEFANKQPREIATTLGLDRTTQLAFYGVGVLPVLRIRLEQTAGIAALIEKFEQAAGTPFPRADIDGHSYWTLQSDGAKLGAILAIVDRQLIISLLPTAAEPEVIRQLLGLTLPAQSLADSGELQRLNGELGLLPYFSGYIDAARLLQAATGPSNAVERAVLAAIDVEKPSLDDACANEWAALAQAWPRVATGYTRFDETGSEHLLLVQAHSDIAATLQKLRAPMPGLSAIDADTLMHFGVGLRVGAVPEVVGQFADSVAKTPWQCAQLQPLNSAFSEAREQVVNPAIYAAAPVLSGVHLAVSRFVFGADTDAMPEVAGKLAVSSDSPAALLAMAGNLLPGLGDLELDTDATPQPLPAMPGLSTDLPAHIAMTPKAIGIAVGAGEEADLGDFLAIDPSRQPLLVAGVSAGFYALLGEQMSRMAALQEPDASAERRAQITQDAAMMQQWYASMAEHMETRIELSERGIELIQQTASD